MQATTVTKSKYVIILENVLSPQKCIQCSGYLITLKEDECEIFLQRMRQKYDLSMVDFEEETCSKCIESAFKCRHCEAIVCNDCLFDLGKCPSFTKMAIYNANARVPLRYFADTDTTYAYCCLRCNGLSIYTDMT